MPNENEKQQLSRLQKLFAAANEGVASVQEVGQIIGQLILTMKSLVDDFLEQLGTVRDDVEQNKTDIEDLQNAIPRERAELEQMIRSVELTPGPPGPKGDTVEGPPGPKGNDAPPQSPVEIRDALETLKGGERLSMDAVDGLKEAIDAKSVEIKPQRNIFGIPSRGMFLFINGVKKGLISNLNIAGGAGVAVSYSKVNGQDTITIDTSGSGITVETPPEAVNASRTDFTVSDEPKWMVADGDNYYDGHGYTYNAGTGKVSFELAPSTYVRAII